MRAASTTGLGLVVEENRQQRATILLVHVDYVIEAHFELTDNATKDDTPAKHSHVQPARCHWPMLSPSVPRHPRVPGRVRAGPRREPLPGPRTTKASRFFRARLADGVLDVQRCLSDGVIA